MQIQTSKFNLLELRYHLNSLLKTTPGVLMASMAVCILATIIMTIASYHVYSGINSTVKTIGQDSVPSIIAAEKIGATLADANANAMNAILIGEKTKDDKYWKIFRDEINRAHDDLITTAQNITYPEERLQILTMQTKLSEYESVIGRTQGQSIQEAMNDFAAANGIMRQDILPASRNLDKVNYQYLNKAYNKYLTSHNINVIVYIITTLLLLSVLVKTQIYLFHKTKRILNPGMLTASIVFVLFQVYAFFTIAGTAHNLAIAKQDAFDSVHSLWQAKAAAYDSNADESLFLLYHGNTEAQAANTVEFYNKAKQLTDIDAEQVIKTKKFGGYLGVELSNITFPGEKEAATTTLHRWAEYIRIDKKIRDLEKQGKYQEALALNIGTQEGQSNYVFAKFDEALGKTLDINQKQFDEKIGSNLQSLSKFPFILSGACIMIIVACIIGLKARIDEYKF